MPGPKLAPFLSFLRDSSGAILFLLCDQMLERLPAQHAGKTAQLLLPEPLPIPLSQLPAVRQMLLAQCLRRSLPGGERRIALPVERLVERPRPFRSRVPCLQLFGSGPFVWRFVGTENVGQRLDREDAIDLGRSDVQPSAPVADDQARAARFDFEVIGARDAVQPLPAFAALSSAQQCGPSILSHPLQKGRVTLKGLEVGGSATRLLRLSSLWGVVVSDKPVLHFELGAGFLQSEMVPKRLDIPKCPRVHLVDSNVHVPVVGVLMHGRNA